MTMYRYLIITVMCVVTNNHLYAAQLQIKSLDEETVINTYQVTLPNGKSMNFDKKLLEQAGMLQPMLRNTKQVIPITEHISHVTAINSDEVSLEQLHSLLSIIAEYQKSPLLALEKLLSTEKLSIKHLINLLHVAGYLEIEPLYQYVTQALAQQVRQNPSNTTKAAIAELPDDWQMDITPSFVMRNKLLQKFLRNYVEPTHTFPGYSASLITWSPDGKKLAWAANGITILDPSTGKIIRTFPEHTSNVSSISWSPDSHQLAFGYFADVPITIADVVTGNVTRPLQDSTIRRPKATWSPNGKYIAAGTEEGLVKMWKAQSGNLLKSWQAHDESVNSLAWSPDSKQLASGSYDHTIKIWKTRTGSLVHTLQDHRAPVTSVAWAPSGKRLASGSRGLESQNNAIHIWDPETGTLLGSLEGNEDVSGIESVEWSPDGQWLASATHDEMAIWDLATGTITRLMPRSGGVVTWSPDGKQVATRSFKDGTIKIWDIAPRLFQLTIPQIDLLERIIRAKKIAIFPTEKPIYESLPDMWKKSLKNMSADGEKKAAEKLEGDESTCVIS